MISSVSLSEVSRPWFAQNVEQTERNIWLVMLSCVSLSEAVSVKKPIFVLWINVGFHWLTSRIAPHLANLSLRVWSIELKLESNCMYYLKCNWTTYS